MISPPPGTKVYLARAHIDMRMGMDALSAEVAQVLRSDPYSGCLFVFRSKRGDRMKILYWDGTGLCLFTKRLEVGSFVWPSAMEDNLQLSPAQLSLLIEGFDWKKISAPNERYVGAVRSPVFM
jgi:transposase